jgi:DNA replication protein DnaC
LRSPFKFLDAYDKRDRDQFFGRDAETEALYELVFETNLVLLYGASGTGKTSLINCGLSNKFQDTDWFSMFVRRGGHMMESLEQEIRHHAITEIPADASMRKGLKSLFYDYYKPIYLIFDQFEEIFILGEAEERQQFFQLLSELMRMSLQLTVILSMREEYIAFLADYEPIVPTLFQHRFRVERMNRSNLAQVITGTCKFHDIKLTPESEVVDGVIESLRSRRGAVDLTNLQVYLDRLYREDRKGRPDQVPTFDPALLQQVGSLEDILGDFLTEQLQVVSKELKDPDKAEIPLAVLFALVTENATKRSLEIPVIKETLKRRKNIHPDDVDFCVQRFTDMRLLREVE